MRLAFVCIAAMVGVALAKPQGYDFPSRNSGNGYDNNDRQGFGGSGGGGGGYPDRQVVSQRPQQYTLGTELDLDDELYSSTGGGYSVFNRTDFYPRTAAVNRVQTFFPSSSPPSVVSTAAPLNRFVTSSTDRNNYRQGNSGYPSTRPSRPRFQQSTTTTRNPFSASSPSGYGGQPQQQLGGTGFGDRFPSRGQQFANNGGFSSTTNRPVDQQQPFVGNFDRVTNTGFGGSGPSGFGANNPTTARPVFPDSINSQLPDSPSVNTNFAGNTGFVNSAVNTGRPVSNNVPFGNNNGPSSFSRPNNNGFGNGVTRPFTGNSNNNRPFNSNNNNDRFGNNNGNRPFGGSNNNNRPFGGGNNNNNNGGFGNNNNNNGFGGGNGGLGGNTGFGNGGNNGFGGGNNGFGNNNNINSSPTDDLSEPANYEFSYEVNDPPSGQNFGHTERRQNEDTVGSYFVLLPDGRLQRVEYTAGVGGYRARVTYEDQGGQLRK